MSLHKQSNKENPEPTVMKSVFKEQNDTSKWTEINNRFAIKDRNMYFNLLPVFRSESDVGGVIKCPFVLICIPKTISEPSRGFSRI
jgi:hypothetical protein